MFDDGPAPFFKRMNVNSAAVKFLDLGWAESPDQRSNRKKLAEQAEVDKQIMFKNTKIQRLKKEIPEVFDYVNKNILNFEKSLKNDDLALKFEVSKEDNKLI